MGFYSGNQRGMLRDLLNYDTQRADQARDIGRARQEQLGATAGSFFDIGRRPWETDFEQAQWNPAGQAERDYTLGMWDEMIAPFEMARMGMVPGGVQNNMPASQGGGGSGGNLGSMLGGLAGSAIKSFSNRDTVGSGDVGVTDLNRARTGLNGPQQTVARSMFGEAWPTMDYYSAPSDFGAWGGL